MFAEPLEEGEDGRDEEEEDGDGEDVEDGASSDGDEKMLIIPGDAVDASSVGTESQIDGWTWIAYNIPRSVSSTESTFICVCLCFLCFRVLLEWY